MEYSSARSPGREVWRRARAQHWVISHAQLVELGFHPQAIKRRVDSGRLHPLFRGVYSVGRPDPGRLGWLMAATLATGPSAYVSHASAARLLGLTTRLPSLPIHVSAPGTGGTRRRGTLRIHHRAPALLAPPLTRTFRGIPVTAPGPTIVDIAIGLPLAEIDEIVSEADKLDLMDPLALRELAAGNPHRPGAGRLRRALDRHTFVLTDSALERLFVPIAIRACGEKPLTRMYLNSHRVDFFFAELGLVVETDGLRYHRTAAQQSRDLHRDQDHAAAGRERLRFSHWQVKHEPAHVHEVLAVVAARLRREVRPRAA